MSFYLRRSSAGDICFYFPLTKTCPIRERESAVFIFVCVSPERRGHFE